MLTFSLIAGFALLMLGGDVLVRGAVAMARRLAISPLIIGLTLVGFGTSMPELVASVQAALAGAPGIAVGNVVGSNIANILLILGVTAVLAPIACDPAAFRRDGAMLVAASLLGAGLLLTGTVGRLAGGGLLLVLAAYVVLSYRLERQRNDASAALHTQEAESVATVTGHFGAALAITLAGIALTVLGARLLVDAAIDLARLAGISETLVGLTVVALGTSLPELATSVMAAWRRQVDVALGNVVGSNIFNILGILGVTALVRPLPVPLEILRLDLWVMLAATALLALAARTGWRVSRREGALLLALYGAYIGWLGWTALGGTAP